MSTIEITRQNLSVPQLMRALREYPHRREVGRTSRTRECGLRRGGRVVEGARLESVYTGNRIAGSNPAPSATLKH